MGFYVELLGAVVYYQVRAMPKRKKTVVVASGGFDPIHVGHVRLFKAARKLGDKLVVILNNDNWLRAKKQYVFMPERRREPRTCSSSRWNNLYICYS